MSKTKEVLLSEWEAIAESAKQANQVTFKIPLGSGLQYELAKKEFNLRYFNCVDVGVGYEWYNLTIPVRLVALC